MSRLTRRQQASSIKALHWPVINCQDRFPAVVEHFAAHAIPQMLDCCPVAAGRVGRLGDITALVDYLSSPEAGFVTGANFVVDGGMTRKMIYVD